MFADSQAFSRASHELRTPLNAILGFGQLLALDELNESQRHSVDQIMAGGRHLLALIEDLLDVSRLDAKGLELQPVDVAALIDDAVSLCAPLAAGESLTVAVDAGEEPLWAWRRPPPPQAGAAQPDLERDQVQPSRRLDHGPGPARRRRRRPPRRGRLGHRHDLPAAQPPVPAVRAPRRAAPRHRGQRARPGRLEGSGRGDGRDDRRRFDPRRRLGLQRPAARRRGGPPAGAAVPQAAEPSGQAGAYRGPGAERPSRAGSRPALRRPATRDEASGLCPAAGARGSATIERRDRPRLTAAPPAASRDAAPAPAAHPTGAGCRRPSRPPEPPASRPCRPAPGPAWSPTSRL